MIAMARIASLSSRAFAEMGIEELAYVKPVVEGDKPAFAIHAADGTKLAVLPDLLEACAIVRRHHLEPVSLH